LPSIVFEDAREGTGACVRLIACIAALLLSVVAGQAKADLVVPAGATTSLGSGVVDLACTDLIVGGTFQVQSGAVLNARNVTIQGGGAIDGGSGVIQLGGNWTANGSFVAGTGEVDFRDLCGVGAASISGSTTFFRSSFVSTTSKNYVFAVGSTQTILSVLEISGTAINPIQFRSATPGQVAFIDLVGSGTQLIQHVGVTDVWSTGQWLAPFQTNEGGGGNARRWFGTGGGGGGGGGGGAVTPVPTMDTAALIALALLLAGSGLWFVRRATARRKEAAGTRAETARDEDSP
jgi:hypothetical protein